MLFAYAASLAAESLVADAFGSAYTWWLMFIAGSLGTWLPLDLVAAWYLRAHKELEDRSGKRLPWFPILIGAIGVLFIYLFIYSFLRELTAVGN